MTEDNSYTVQTSGNLSLPLYNSVNHDFSGDEDWDAGQSVDRLIKFDANHSKRISSYEVTYVIMCCQVFLVVNLLNSNLNILSGSEVFEATTC